MLLIVLLSYRQDYQNHCSARHHQTTSTWANWLSVPFFSANVVPTTVVPSSTKLHWLPYYNRTGPNNRSDLPRILFWTQMYGEWFAELAQYGKASGVHKVCPYKCYITYDREVLHRSDAVMFYGRDLNLADMPQIRAQQQKWVYWSLEPPTHTVGNFLTHLNNAFNWTQTYRHDSDFLDLYGKVNRLNKSVPYSTNSLRKRWKNKDIMAVWPVSSCRTPGKRHEYVQILQKYIRVDIYGNCGNHSCPRDYEYSCHLMFQDRYFFYLSFENSICDDYVTEKLYITLLHDLIPVVLGGANYSAVAPPGSFINALSFKTPKDLADHLIAVAKDFKLYQSYFAWRGDYEAQRLRGYKFCDLCRSLYSASFRVTTVYTNILQWWNMSSHCRNWDRSPVNSYE